MSSNISPARIPTREEITARIRQLLPGMVMYHPGDRWWAIEYSGDPIWFPPDLPGTPKVSHPTRKDKHGNPEMWTANGEVLVRDRYGVIYNPRNRRPKGIGPLVGQQAGDMVAFCVENYAEYGVILLEQDKHDGERREAARELMAQSRRAWAEKQVREYQRRVEEFRRQPKNAGQEPPAMTKNQRDAQEVLDELKDKGVSGQFRFRCEACLYSTNDQGRFELHLRVNHPPLWADYQVEQNREHVERLDGKKAKTAEAAKKKTRGKKKDKDEEYQTISGSDRAANEDASAPMRDVVPEGEKHPETIGDVDHLPPELKE